MFYPIFFPIGGGGGRYSGPPPTLKEVLIGIPIVLLIIIQCFCFMYATFNWIGGPSCLKYTGDKDDMGCIIIEKFGSDPTLVECYAGMFIMEWRMLGKII